MTYLLKSWKESLSLFIPKNAKLFILVTIKTILQSYKLILKQLWWLFLISWGLDVLSARYCFISLCYLAPLISWLVTIFCVYLAIRPSMPRKTLAYYLGHARYFLPFFVITLFIFLTICRGFAAFFSIASPVRIKLFKHYFIQFTPMPLIPSFYSTTTYFHDSFCS